MAEGRMLPFSRRHLYCNVSLVSKTLQARHARFTVDLLLSREDARSKVPDSGATVVLALGARGGNSCNDELAPYLEYVGVDWECPLGPNDILLDTSAILCRDLDVICKLCGWAIVAVPEDVNMASSLSLQSLNYIMEVDYSMTAMDATVEHVLFV